MKLRPYQVEAIRNVYGKMVTGSRSIVLQSPTGSGKTAMASQIITDAAIKRGRSVLVLAHRGELLDQLSASLSSWGVPHGVIRAGMATDSLCPVQVASIQSLDGSVALPHLGRDDLIVVDECFPPGTMVGERRIEDILVGDTVPSFNDELGTKTTGVVEYLFKKTTTRLVRITHALGQFTCTPNHPIMTTTGWREAGWLTTIDSVLSIGGIRSDNDKSRMDRKVRPVFNGNAPYRAKSEPGEVQQKSVLLENVRSGLLDSSINGIQQKELAQKNAREQPDEGPSSAGQGIDSAADDGTQTTEARREWDRAYGPSNAPGRSVGMEHGTHCENQEKPKNRLSVPLQTGHREHGSDDRNRSGWRVPQCSGAPESGQQEDGTPKWSRVVHIEILEPGGSGEFERVCPNGIVYNIEVATTHTYIADGIVTHNCHRQDGDKVFVRYPEVRRLGLTATPYRMRGTNVVPLSPQYSELVVAATPRALEKDGYIVPVKIIAPKLPTAALEADLFDDEHLTKREKVMGNAQVMGDVVETWKKWGPRRTIAYCCGISHSKKQAEAFKAAGIGARHISGEEALEKRRDILASFRAGDFEILLNSDLLIEGLDVPFVSRILMLRPTQSPAVYLQQAGRGVRPAPGKTDCEIFDHAGNFFYHGHPYEARFTTMEPSPGIGRPVDDSPLDGVWRCPDCFCCVTGRVPAACPYCDMPVEHESRKVRVVGGHLVEYDEEALRIAKEQQDKEAEIRAENDKRIRALFGVAMRSGMRGQSARSYVFSQLAIWKRSGKQWGDFLQEMQRKSSGQQGTTSAR